MLFSNKHSTKATAPAMDTERLLHCLGAHTLCPHTHGFTPPCGWYCSKWSSAESSSPAHKTNPTFFWWTGVRVECSFTDFPRIYTNWITGVDLSGLTISHTRGNTVFHTRKASTQTLHVLYENIGFRLLLVYLFCSRQYCKCHINYWFSQYKI